MHVLVNTACTTAWNPLPEWNSTPRHQQAYNHYKGSHGAGKYSRNLCAKKNWCFNKRNCRLGRHNRTRRNVSTLRPTSVHRKAHKTHKEERKTELLDPVLKVKTRTMREYKIPFPFGAIKQFALSVIVRMLNFENLLSSVNHFCLLKSRTCATTLYPTN